MEGVKMHPHKRKIVFNGQQALKSVAQNAGRRNHKHRWAARAGAQSANLIGERLFKRLKRAADDVQTPGHVSILAVLPTYPLCPSRPPTVEIPLGLKTYRHEEL